MNVQKNLSYISHLTLENVRCFGKAETVSFLDDKCKPARWTIILGENGTGKTTILKGIVGSLPDPDAFLEKRSHLDTSFSPSLDTTWRNKWSLKRQDGEAPSDLKIGLIEMLKSIQGTPSLIEQELTYTQYHRRAMYNKIPNSDFDTRLWSPILCFAYGANRKMASRSLSKSMSSPNETLFDEEALIRNPEDFFLQLDYEAAKSKKKSDLDRVVLLILKVLPNVLSIEVRKIGKLNRQVLFKTSFGNVGIDDLSMGYKTSLAWLLDFATKMIYFHPNSENPFNEPAILVIDEIDLHMHPSWQRDIINILSKTFPNTQFVATAHSPLIVQSAADANIILLKKVRNRVTVDNDPINVQNWRVDQILTSDLFGLNSNRPKNIESQLLRRSVLLRKGDNITKVENEELQKLNKLVNGLPTGENQTDIEVREFIHGFFDTLKAAKNKS